MPKIHGRERTVSSINGARKIECERMKLDPHLMPCAKINSKLDGRPETIKLLEHNRSFKILDLTMILDKTPKAQARKAKTDRENFLETSA